MYIHTISKKQFNILKQKNFNYDFKKNYNCIMSALILVNQFLAKHKEGYTIEDLKEVHDGSKNIENAACDELKRRLYINKKRELINFHVIPPHDKLEKLFYEFFEVSGDFMIDIKLK